MEHSQMLSRKHATETGTLKEMIGNRAEAKEILVRGLQISNFLKLSPFFVSFSTAIGKICYKTLLGSS